jgi:hypothetical protein
VAAKDQKNRKLDETVKGGDIPGTWYSGHSWDESLSIGTDKFNKLPIDALAT